MYLNKKVRFGIKMAQIGFERSAYSKKRVGAAFIKGGTVIIGSNSMKTTPISKALGTHWEREHAEMNVLKSLRKEECSNGHLFVYRHRHDGTIGMARPCIACQVLIRSKGIKKITYTTEAGIATEILL